MQAAKRGVSQICNRALDVDSIACRQKQQVSLVFFLSSVFKPFELGSNRVDCDGINES